MRIMLQDNTKNAGIMLQSVMKNARIMLQKVLKGKYGCEYGQYIEKCICPVYQK